MPGSVVVSENTRKLCEGYFLLKPLGATKVRGVSGSVNVYEVNGLGPLRTRLQRSAGRGLTKFVGRDTRSGHSGTRPIRRLRGRANWSRPWLRPE